MNTIKLDFSNCNYIMAVYEYLKKQFNLPDYFGNNLDALWDCLDGEYCPTDAHIEVRGIGYLNEKFDGYGEKIKKYLKICQKNMEMKI